MILSSALLIILSHNNLQAAQLMILVSKGLVVTFTGRIVL